MLCLRCFSTEFTGDCGWIKTEPRPQGSRGDFFLQNSGSVKYNVVSRSIRHAHSVTHMAKNDTNSFNPFNQMQWTYNKQAKQLKVKTPSVFYRKGPPSYKLVYNSKLHLVIKKTYRHIHHEFCDYKFLLRSYGKQYSL